MDKWRVLIVEDEPLIAMELNDRLERNHYTVCGMVAHGEEAVRQFEQFKPDVILMDVHLAGKLNGIETAKQLRAIRDIPVIYLTAYSDPWLIEQAAKTEPYGYLVKPFDERELRATIDLAIYKYMTEQRVRDNERRLSALFDQSTVGIAEINTRTGWFLRINQRYREIAGYELDALSVTDTRLVTDHDDLVKEQTQLKALYEGRLGGFSMEKRCTTPDGSVRWIHQTVSPLWEVCEEPTSCVVVIHDVTERKMAEAALAQAEKLESLSTLAAGLAHDFNNHLQTILGLSSVAVGLLSPKHQARSSLQQIEKTVADAARLVRQLTAYAGIRRFAPASVEVHELVRKTLASVKILVPPSVHLVVDDPGQQIFVQGDPTQIQEALVNLLQNAVEAIGERSGEVRVLSSILVLTEQDLPRWSVSGLTPTPGRYVMLNIKDSGCGIALESLGKVFDPFYTTKFLGRGLGLSAVLGIIRKHQGGIYVDSTPGVGTTVSIALPMVVQKTPTSDSDGVSKKSRAVLLIDDDVFVQEFVVSALAREGVPVLTVSDGQGGVELFRERYRDIALVIVDMDMQGVSGAALLTHLREIAPDVVIVIVSGYAELETLQVTGVESVGGFLQKPYTPAMLLLEVKKFVLP